MLSGVLVLSGPMMLPPPYCISILLGPMLFNCCKAYWVPVRPSVAVRMMDAEPMTMPSIVSRNRTFEARKLSTARCTVSRNAMVEVALASVRSKLVRVMAGFGEVAVAISVNL